MQGISDQTPGIDHVFVLRFWHEPVPEKSNYSHSWRARIAYVNREKETYIDGIEGAFDVVRSILTEVGLSRLGMKP